MLVYSRQYTGLPQCIASIFKILFWSEAESKQREKNRNSNLLKQNFKTRSENDYKYLQSGVIFGYNLLVNQNLKLLVIIAMNLKSKEFSLATTPINEYTQTPILIQTFQEK